MKPNTVTFEEIGNGRTMLREGGLSLSVPCTPMDARYIGLQLQVFLRLETPDLSQSWKRIPLIMATTLGHAVDLICDVVHTSDKHTSKARGQLEDAGCDMSGLSNLDVAILDVLAREKLVEAAREIEDPFNPISTGPWDTPRHFRVPVPRFAHLFESYRGEDHPEGPFSQEATV